jgi:hypothetical protein
MSLKELVIGNGWEENLCQKHETARKLAMEEDNILTSDGNQYRRLSALVFFDEDNTLTGD